MRIYRVKRLITRVLITAIILFGAVAVTGTTVQAQSWRRFDGQRGRIGFQPRRFYYPRRRWYWHNRYDWWLGSAYPYDYPGYFPSTHVTEGQGYRDGLDDGKDDVKDRKSYDPYRHKDYKNAITSAYIEGYLRGYSEGYRQTAG